MTSKQYIQKVPTPKFYIGQQVFCVRIVYGTTERECPDCLGKKEWTCTAPSGEFWQAPCNTCNSGWFSTGRVIVYEDRVSKEKLTIGSIQINTAANEKDGPIRYMCIETGVGSGSIYREQELFASDEEANEYGKQELNRVIGLREKENLEKLASAKKSNPARLQKRKK